MTCVGRHPNTAFLHCPHSLPYSSYIAVLALPLLHTLLPLGLTQLEKEEGSDVALYLDF